jgi:hypothetical protein
LTYNIEKARNELNKAITIINRVRKTTNADKELKHAVFAIINARILIFGKGAGVTGRKGVRVKKA